MNAALATVALGLWLAVRLQFPHTFHLRERCSCDTTGPPDVKTYMWVNGQNVILTSDIILKRRLLEHQVYLGGMSGDAQAKT